MVRLAGAATAALKLAFGQGPLAMIQALSEKATEIERQRDAQRHFASEQRSARADLSRVAGGFEGGGGDDEWEDVEDVSGIAAERSRLRARARSLACSLAHLTDFRRRRPQPPTSARAEEEARRPRRPALITSYCWTWGRHARAREGGGDERACKPICPPRA
jgi:hypothetical protein